MESSTFLCILCYAVILFFVIHYIYTQYRQAHAVTVATVIPESSWWPWHMTPYNDWPFWTGWWSGGSDGGYQRMQPAIPQFRAVKQDRPWGGASRSANRGA